MERHRLTIPPVLLGLAILAAGCAEPPTASVDAAKQELTALADEAATYAPNAYATAEDAVGQLDAELATQEATFALMRDYERAVQLVGAVETATGQVRQAIVAERQRLSAAADGLVADANQAITEARASIEELPEDELEEDQAVAWEADLTDVSASLEEVASLLAAAQPVDARREAEAAVNAANAVNGAVAAFAAELQAEREAAAERAARGEITIPRSVMVDGQSLAAGMYLLQLAEDAPDAAGRWVEFVSEGDVAGRGLAVVIPDAEISEVAESPGPRNEAQVMELREGEYVRVWLNRDGTNYLLHLPTS